MKIFYPQTQLPEKSLTKLLLHAVSVIVWDKKIYLKIEARTSYLIYSLLVAESSF